MEKQPAPPSPKQPEKKPSSDEPRRLSKDSQVGVTTISSGQIPEEELLTALEQMPWASTFIGFPVFAITSALLLVIGSTFIVLAGLGFIMAWGLWNGKNWARVITIILSGVSVVFSLFSLPGSLLSIIINLTILYYLMQPYIKEYYV